MNKGISATTKKRQTELSRHWNRWMNIVDQIAQNTDRAKRLKEKKYRQIHSTLIKEIDACLADISSEEQREILNQMKQTCKPWVSLSSFFQAEKHIVTDLLHTGQHLHFQLTGHYSIQRRSIFKVVKWVFLLSLCLVPVVFWGINQYVTKDATINLRGYLYRKFYFLQEVNAYDILPVVVVVVTLFGFWMLRSTKQY